MASKCTNVRVELEKPIDLDVDEWAKHEGRSKRRQAAVLLGKLCRLRKNNPQELERLGLIDRAMAAT